MKCVMNGMRENMTKNEYIQRKILNNTTHFFSRKTKMSISAKLRLHQLFW